MLVLRSGQVNKKYFETTNKRRGYPKNLEKNLNIIKRWETFIWHSRVIDGLRILDGCNEEI